MTHISYCCSETCGAPIYWLENVRTGRKAPIDAEPDPRGNVVVSLESGQYRMAQPSDPVTERHQNHFATCPDQQRFREGA